MTSIRQNNFEAYMDSVYSQLTDNATDEYKNNYITYTYPMDKVNMYLPYFRCCMEAGLSPYKALLYFNDHLSGNFDMQKPMDIWDE